MTPKGVARTAPGVGFGPPVGPSGVTSQPATASTMPARASKLARTTDGRGRGCNDMSWLLPKRVIVSSFRLWLRRCGRGCECARCIGQDQRCGDQQDEQFPQAHTNQVRLAQVIGD